MSAVCGMNAQYLSIVSPQQYLAAEYHSVKNFRASMLSSRVLSIQTVRQKLPGSMLAGWPMLFLHPVNSVKALKATYVTYCVIIYIYIYIFDLCVNTGVFGHA